MSASVWEHEDLPRENPRGSSNGLKLSDYFVPNSDPKYKRYRCPGCNTNRSRAAWHEHQRNGCSVSSARAAPTVRCPDPNCKDIYTTRERMLDHYSNCHEKLEIKEVVLECRKQFEELKEQLEVYLAFAILDRRRSQAQRIQILQMESKVHFYNRGTGGVRGSQYYNCSKQQHEQYLLTARKKSVKDRVINCVAFITVTPQDDDLLRVRYLNYHTHDLRKKPDDESDNEPENMPTIFKATSSNPTCKSMISYNSLMLVKDEPRESEPSAKKSKDVDESIMRQPSPMTLFNEGDMETKETEGQILLHSQFPTPSHIPNFESTSTPILAQLQDMLPPITAPYRLHEFVNGTQKLARLEELISQHGMSSQEAQTALRLLSALSSVVEAMDQKYAVSALTDVKNEEH